MLKQLIILVLVTLSVWAAPAGGVFIATDTTATNARPSSVTITPLVGGTNVSAGSIVLTNTTASRALVADSAQKVTNSVTTAAELAFVSGVTSAIQTQLDSKSTFMGTAGTVVNTGTPVANTIPVYTDTTGTNIAKSTSAVILGDGSSATLTETYSLSGASDPALTAANASLACNTTFSATGYTTAAATSRYLITTRGGIGASGNGAWNLSDSAGTGFTSLTLGPDDASPNNATLDGASGVGTDIAGGNLIVAGGQSTGTGAPGKVQGQRSIVGTTGSSVNAYGTAFSLGGTLNVNTTTTGNVGAGEDDLITYSIPAGQMSVNGDTIDFDMAGTFAATVNAKRLRVYFGATAIFDSTSLVLNGLAWRVHGKVIRTGATTQKATIEATIGGTLLSAVNSTITQYTTPSETLSGAVIIKATGSDDGGVPADNAVVEQLSTIRFYTAP